MTIECNASGKYKQCSNIFNSLHCNEKNYTRVHNSIHQLVVQFDTIVWNKHELKWHSFCE